MSRQKITIIGGTGFIGRHLTRRLLAHGHSVTIITRHRERHRRLLIHPTLRLIQGDVHADNVLDQHFNGSDIVINLSGVLNQYGGHEHRFETVHAELPQRIAAACVRQGVPRLLHMSALGADASGPSEYQRSKGNGEDAVLAAAAEHGLSVTIFRPSVVFGADDDFINRFASLLRSMPFMPLACPDARFQPVSINDVVAAFMGSINNPATIGQTYDLVGPDEYTLEQLVRYIDGLLGTNRKIIRLGSRLSGWLAKVMQFAPGKPLTPDNIASMSVPNVSDNGFPQVFNIEPERLESLAPVFLRTNIDPRDVFRRQRSN